VVEARGIDEPACFVVDRGQVQRFAKGVFDRRLSWFDSWLRNILPQWLQEFVVCFAGTLPNASTYPLGTMDQCMQSQSAATNGFKTYIELPNGAPLQALADPTAAFPSELNVSRRSTQGQPGALPLHEFLPGASSVVSTMRGTPGANPAWSSLHVVVIGHTHHARISVDDSNPGAPLLLMDCGAWIENYASSDGTAGPNCQLGVVAGNDLRIYQLDRLTS
jgi:hypothetical protein